MNLKYIQEKLNEIFLGESRQIVFWYDENAEFCDEINNLQLENAQIYHLKQDNWLYTKYFIEVENPDTNYLIYAPFPKPDDKNNYLADIAYYATPFSADKISLITQELNIPSELKSVLKKYPKFWNANSRVNSFKDLNIEKYSERKIIVGILCVLSKVKIVSFDELLRKVLTEDIDEKKYLSEFQKMDIIDDFWRLSREKYGYEDNNPTIEKFLIFMIITYSSTKFTGNLPKAWEKHISNKKNSISVFINNLMSNTNYNRQYDDISRQIAKTINLEWNLKRISVENYFDCDTFEIFDENIIDHLTDLLVSNQEELLLLYDLLDERQKTHFYKQYEYHYEVIKWANFLIKQVNEFSNEPYLDKIEDIIMKYCDDWSFIERSYRKFYYSYDQIDERDRFHDLRQLIENMYTNTYLTKVSSLWSDKLDEFDSINELPLNKQYNFYKKNIVRAVKKQKTVVIISDGFRYGCATELKDKLDLDPNRNSTIKPMISSIPSYTALGMACLLPHEKINFDKNYNVLVDDKPSMSTYDRQKILEKYHNGSMALSYDDVMSLSKYKLREKLKNRDLIYVYHNQIDARGDKLATENEVFTAAEEAIQEINKLINKLTNDGFFANYFITADHGFIYKRDKLNESDKVDMTLKSVISKNKRYLLSNTELDIEGTIDFTLDYLDIHNVCITVPRGVDIFKTQGAGQNYVHGGASLQEVIVPVLHVKSKKGSKNQENVELNLISLNNRITNLSTLLTFAQKENISNRVLPWEAKLYFVDVDGEKISNEVIIHANKNVNSAKDREFKEKFTLRNKTYSKTSKYYLIIEDMKTETEISRHEFIIDIAILDDFDI